MLENRRILITGANGGIGISISEILLKNNANLILLYHKNRDKIDEFLHQNESLKSKIKLYSVDLLDESNLDKILEEILQSGSVDTVIHSVSDKVQHNNVSKFSWNDYELNIELQTKSFFKIIQAFLPNMKKSKFGKFINILTSYTVGVPPSHISSSVVGKYSLLGLSKALSVELAQYGISIK